MSPQHRTKMSQLAAKYQGKRSQWWKFTETPLNQRSWLHQWSSRSYIGN